jgi:hypothetical protein
MAKSNGSLESVVARLDERTIAIQGTLQEIKDTWKMHSQNLETINGLRITLEDKAHEWDKAVRFVEAEQVRRAARRQSTSAIIAWVTAAVSLAGSIGYVLIHLPR